MKLLPYTLAIGLAATPALAQDEVAACDTTMASQYTAGDQQAAFALGLAARLEYGDARSQKIGQKFEVTLDIAQKAAYELGERTRDVVLTAELDPTSFDVLRENTKPTLSPTSGTYLTDHAQISEATGYVTLSTHTPTSVLHIGYTVTDDFTKAPEGVEKLATRVDSNEDGIASLDEVTKFLVLKLGAGK